MLLYGGTGLVLAGIITFFFSGRIQADAEKAARMKRQSPILIAVGGLLLGLLAVTGA